MRQSPRRRPLIQYFLKKIYDQPVFTNRDRSIRVVLPPPSVAMKIDGWCGPVTLMWILKYQMDIHSLGARIEVNRRIEPARAGWPTWRPERSAMVWLNRSFRKRYPELFDNLAAAADLPDPLREALAHTEPGVPPAWPGGAFSPAFEVRAKRSAARACF